MKKLLIPAIVATTLAASSAFAQTSPTPTTPAPSTPPASSPSTNMPSASTTAPMVLSEAEAKTWVDKVIYSNDGQNLGEVAAVQRDTSGKVLEVHADIGGFLGMGETRVRVQPSQFMLEGDRLKLNMTAEQAKALPKISK